jgi:hypothetical protein
LRALSVKSGSNVFACQLLAHALALAENFEQLFVVCLKQPALELCVAEILETAFLALSALTCRSQLYVTI